MCQVNEDSCKESDECLEGCYCDQGFIQDGFGNNMVCVREDEPGLKCPCDIVDESGKCFNCKRKITELKKFKYFTKIQYTKAWWRGSFKSKAGGQKIPFSFRNLLEYEVDLVWINYRTSGNYDRKTIF